MTGRSTMAKKLPDQALHPEEDGSGRSERSDADVITLESRRLKAARTGDGGAFADLVRPHLSVMLRVAARAGGNRALAEDAVQETLGLAYERLGRYRAGSSFRAWLLAMVSRRAWTLRRAEARRRDRELKVAPPERASSPEQAMRAVQCGERIAEMLETMPEKRRRAAVLRLDGGLSYAEIGAALETSEGSARVLVHMAVKTLRAALSDLVEQGVSDDAEDPPRRTR
jgi:RNA polymerase sigma-70 factor (ECF subfamily)